MFYRARDILKMMTLDDGLLFEEGLNNIDSDKEEDNDVDENSSDDEEMKKIFKTGKKELGELNGRTNILQKPFAKMNIFEENSFSQKISNRKTIFMKELNQDYESNFLFSVKQV